MPPVEHGMTQFEKKVSLSCSPRAARSAVVMLQVWYVIAFQFDSDLGDFPFLFFKTIFITFQTFPFMC